MERCCLSHLTECRMVLAEWTFTACCLLSSLPASVAPSQRVVHSSTSSAMAKWQCGCCRLKSTARRSMCCLVAVTQDGSSNRLQQQDSQGGNR